MKTNRFIEALGKPARIEYRGADRIPDTDKVRTYCSNASLYSRESDLENIVSDKYRASITRRKR